MAKEIIIENKKKENRFIMGLVHFIHNIITKHEKENCKMFQNLISLVIFL